jgi:hypothetical protein
VSHLQCPECRLTVPAAAYYLRGDQCPRCLTSMQPYVRPRPERPAPGSRHRTEQLGAVDVAMLEHAVHEPQPAVHRRA